MSDIKIDSPSIDELNSIEMKYNMSKVGEHLTLSFESPTLEKWVTVILHDIQMVDTELKIESDFAEGTLQTIPKDLLDDVYIEISNCVLKSFVEALEIIEEQND